MSKIGDMVGENTDCGNREEIKTSWMHGVLSLAPCYVGKSRYVTKASLRHITANDEASSLSGDFIIAHHSPALDLKRERTQGRKREKFCIYLDVTHTHTHTRPEPGQP